MAKKDGIARARGSVFLYPDVWTVGFINVDNKIVQVPFVLFSFWQQFDAPVVYSEAREEFIKTGLEAELFDECFDALVSASLISVEGWDMT